MTSIKSVYLNLGSAKKNADISKTCYLNNSSLATDWYKDQIRTKVAYHYRNIVAYFFQILLTPAEIWKIPKFAVKCWQLQQNFKIFPSIYMILLMMCNFGSNFMFMPSAKLELFKKQVLLMFCSFFDSCHFSQNWQDLNLSNINFNFVHRNTLL